MRQCENKTTIEIVVRVLCQNSGNPMRALTQNIQSFLNCLTYFTHLHAYSLTHVMLLHLTYSYFSGLSYSIQVVLSLPQYIIISVSQNATKCSDFCAN